MRVCVIGIGAIAPLHLDALLAEGQAVVALCDIDVQRCHAAKAKYGLDSAVYSDYIEMLEKEKPDSVHICTPHYLHAEMVCAALARDINVVCEKPLAISFQQLDEIESAVKVSKARLGVCFQNRFLSSMQYIKNYFNEHPLVSSSATLVWDRNDAYYASEGWRGKWKTEGGGVMINQAIHSLDMLAWVSGMPKSVIAHVSNNTHKSSIEVEDTAYGLFTLEDGRRFVINATNCSKYSFPISLMFTDGENILQLLGSRLLINGEPIELEEETVAPGKPEWGVGHVKFVRRFYSCLSDGTEFPIDFYEGARAVRLLLKMYESDGEEINI